VRAAHTAKDGAFALAAVSPTPVAWCTTTPVGSCRVAGGEPGLGRRVPDYVLTAGMTVRGRFVDAKDAPVAGVVVRATGFDREPIAVSDAGGRFALLCVPEHAGLRFQLPGRNESSTTDSLLGPLDCTVRLDADGRPAAPERDVKLSLRVQTGDGRAIDGEAVRFTRVSDGWSIVAVTADDTGEKPGTLAVDVPGGTYEVTQATPLEPATFAPFQVGGCRGGRHVAEVGHRDAPAGAHRRRRGAARSEGLARRPWSRGRLRRAGGRVASPGAGDGRGGRARAAARVATRGVLLPRPRPRRPRPEGGRRGARTAQSDDRGRGDDVGGASDL
jgi:hypothetical protein